MVEIHGGHSPFSCIKSACQDLVFNAETRSFYDFPPFKSELVGCEQYQLPRWPLITSKITIIVPLFHVVLTKAHVISFFPFCTDPPEAPSTLVQAFTIPADSQLDNGIGILRLSHEGFIPNHDIVKNADIILSWMPSRAQSTSGFCISFSMITWRTSASLASTSHYLNTHPLRCPTSGH
ncbi:hypothetical protein L210DRAFT_45748 [Boletus edulis BED1]|uniref:Uncharacterized protein n=1 Tax=Boletus edulis BED1 TaxID=1328754 RepID=A0AAD4C1U5_BOLED|nr:hypothetical protein L210DRAFT_45748 [Boletus edulis BED1]